MKIKQKSVENPIHIHFFRKKNPRNHQLIRMKHIHFSG